MANNDNPFGIIAMGTAVVGLSLLAYYLYQQKQLGNDGSIVDFLTNFEQGNSNMTDISGITSDPNTWPKGDKIWDICRAIAFAEGANVPGSNPDRLNNPGDISDGSVTFAALIPEFHSGSVVTHFPDKSTGWQWLYNKVKNHINGDSTVYPADLSILAFAQKYAGNWQNWVSNVASYLKISDPSSITFSQYVNS